MKDNIAARADLGIKVLTTSALTGEGIEEFRAFLHDHPGTWTLVGRSGVGKTSLVRKLLPDIDVGPVGELSEYWGTGRHTTTRSCIFPLTDQCGIVDSPGIRQFVPGGLEQEHLFRFFPSIDELICKYRNCQHRPNEDGCVAESQVAKSLLSSYRTLLEELIDMTPRP